LYWAAALKLPQTSKQAQSKETIPAREADPVSFAALFPEIIVLAEIIVLGSCGAEKGL